MNKVGFTNGCYDILHVGHLHLLRYLKSKCDTVVVGIDSDIKVKAMKGPARPFNNQEDRKLMLQSLRFVDYVHIFDTQEELVELVKQTSPDLMVIGDDYKGKNVVGAEHAKKLHFFEKIDGYSTTKIIRHTPNR